MELPPEDFESSASTSFTTPARDESYTNLLLLSSKNRLLTKAKTTENVIFGTLRINCAKNLPAADTDYAPLPYLMLYGKELWSEAFQWKYPAAAKELIRQ